LPWLPWAALQIYNNFYGSFTLAKFVRETVSDSDTRQSLTVLALATLGWATENRNHHISVLPLKVAKASLNVSLLRIIIANIILPTFANVDITYGSFTLAMFVSKTVSESTCPGHLGRCDKK
jgi:hypothetical protein